MPVTLANHFALPGQGQVPSRSLRPLAPVEGVTTPTRRNHGGYPYRARTRLFKVATLELTSLFGNWSKSARWREKPEEREIARMLFTTSVARGHVSRSDQ